MDAFIQFLIDWGYLGLFISPLLADSIVPFSSEAVLGALVIPATGLDPWLCLIAASTGNLLGSLTCYGVGRMGRIDWLIRYFHMKPEKIEKMQNYLNGKGAFMGFFSFLPFVGDVLSVALGFMRSNIWIVSLSMFIGKVLRYALIILIIRGLL